LEQVVDFYNHGAGNKLFPKLYFSQFCQTNLIPTEAEKQDLVFLLKTLTDTTSATIIPKMLPKLNGKYARLNNRIVDGKY